jgi:hypothetical protein
MKDIKRLIFTFFIALSITSCEDLVDGDGDINVNPNNPTETGYQSVLISAQVGQIILQSGETARRAGIFGGTHTGIDRQHEGYSSYTVTTSDFDDLWDDVFINAYRNAKLTEELAREQGIVGITVGITQVLQALSLGTGASLYGDIPFDDLNDLAIENPAFEDQLSVYNKIQLLLEDAIISLAIGSGRPASGSDFMLDGNVNAWTQVAYTLKARYYMHTKEYDQAYNAAQSGISNMENALYAPHTDALAASNLNWQFFANGTRGPDLVVSDFIVSIVSPDNAISPDFTNYRGNAKTNEGARYDYLFESNTVGFQPNQSSGQFAGQTTSAPIVTYEENLLILAEAGLRSNDVNTGLALLNDFRAFMANGGYLSNPDPGQLQYDPYVIADFETGGIENLGGIATQNALLREVLEERYVTLFGQIEIFNDTRRTAAESGMAVLVVPNVGNELPQRFIYPQSEIDRNSNIPNPLPSLFDVTQVNK